MNAIIILNYFGGKDFKIDEKIKIIMDWNSERFEE
jgi:hypothetical protein